MLSMIDEEDRLGLRPTLFLSAGILLNLGVGILYASFKMPSHSSVRKPLLVMLYGCATWTLGFLWPNRESLRLIEKGDSEVAQYYRRALLSWNGS